MYLQRASRVALLVSLISIWIGLPYAFCAEQAAEPGQTEKIAIGQNSRSHAFPHFWEHMFGSGRAVLSLRESYRQDLVRLKEVADPQYIRFHAIFHDESGVYDEDASGNPIYNWTYVDQIYDGLLKNGVRPLVELSFMPRKLSATPVVEHPFWYKQVVSEPKDWNKWEEFVYQFCGHLIARYGADEVSRWYFEVWNEPNIDFWAAVPKEEKYYKLYDCAARAVKRANPALKVGGPATAQAAWVDRFIQHCVEGNIPVDFVTTHVYGTDTSMHVLGTNEEIPLSDMVALAVKKVHQQVLASKKPKLPVFFTEYNAGSGKPYLDTAFLGPWLANNIRQCDGLVDELSYWCFSDVFEEHGIAKNPYHGGFGLLAVGGIPKPSFNDFLVLHQLGDTRIEVDSSSAIVTRKLDGALAIALWNYVQPDTQNGARKHFEIVLPSDFAKVAGRDGKLHADIQIVDDEHGNSFTRWKQMGSPPFPSREQQDELKRSSQLPPASLVPIERLSTGELKVTVTLSPHALALLRIN